MADDSGRLERGKVSGRVVVIVLFATAFLMWGIVFVTGLRQRAADRASRAAAEAADSAVTPEQVRSWMKTLPQTWIKVSFVEGQGYVLYVPCYSSNSGLRLRTAPDSVPGLDCEYCDSLDSYAVKTIVHTRKDSVWEMRLEPAAGRMRILPVDDSLLKSFPEAPFKDKLLIWTRQREGGRIDSMLFVPKSQETEFETLRAEDENPEGCGGGAPE
jgi:hypothetical protein